MLVASTLLNSCNHHRGHGNPLTHWGRVTHICVSKLTIIGSDNGLSPGRRQAIIWTNAGILLIGPLGTNFSEILIGTQTFPFKKMHLKMSSAKWRPYCLGLNELIPVTPLKCSVPTWWAGFVSRVCYHVSMQIHVSAFFIPNFLAGPHFLKADGFQGTPLLTLKHRETHGCVVSTVATDALVLKHQAISIHNAD